MIYMFFLYLLLIFLFFLLFDFLFLTLSIFIFVFIISLLFLRISKPHSLFYSLSTIQNSLTTHHIKIDKYMTLIYFFLSLFRFISIFVKRRKINPEKNHTKQQNNPGFRKVSDVSSFGTFLFSRIFSRPHSEGKKTKKKKIHFFSNSIFFLSYQRRNPKKKSIHKHKHIHTHMHINTLTLSHS